MGDIRLEAINDLSYGFSGNGISKCPIKILWPRNADIIHVEAMPRGVADNTATGQAAVTYGNSRHIHAAAEQASSHFLRDDSCTAETERIKEDIHNKKLHDRSNSMSPPVSEAINSG